MRLNKDLTKCLIERKIYRSEYYHLYKVIAHLFDCIIIVLNAVLENCVYTVRNKLLEKYYMSKNVTFFVK